MRLSPFLAALLSASAVSAQADVAGTARVVDGDTIVVDGEHVRLEGRTWHNFAAIAGARGS